MLLNCNEQATEQAFDRYRERRTNVMDKQAQLNAM